MTDEQLERELAELDDDACDLNPAGIPMSDTESRPGTPPVIHIEKASDLD
ncbi:hypothetical protein [Nocardia salmonicida]